MAPPSQPTRRLLRHVFGQTGRDHPPGRQPGRTARGHLLESRTRLLDSEGRELLSLTFPDPKTWVSLDLLASREPRIVRPDQDAIEVADQKGHPVVRLQQGLAGMNPGPAAISLDGSKLALGWSTSRHWEITVHPLNRNERSVVRIDPTTFSWSLSFSPDGSRVASAGEDGVTRIWNSTTGAKVAECRGHRSKVLRVSFRSDGKRLLTTSADGTVRQWDPANGHEAVPPYERHTGEVMTAAYSPNGQWVASEAPTGRSGCADDRQDRDVLHGHTAFVKEVGVRRPTAAALTSTSSSSGSQGNDGDSTVRLWDLGRRRPAPCAAATRATSTQRCTVRTASGLPREAGTTRCDCGTLKRESTVPHSSTRGPSTDSGLWARQLLVSQHLRRRGAAPGLGRRDRRRRTRSTGPEVRDRRCDQRGRKPGRLGRPVRSRQRIGDSGRPEPCLAPRRRRMAGKNRAGLQPRWAAARRHGRRPGDDRHLGCAIASADRALRGSHRPDLLSRLQHRRASSGVGQQRPHPSSASGILTPEPAWQFCRATPTKCSRLSFTRTACGWLSAGRNRAVWLWDLGTGQEVARLTGHTDYVFSLAFSPDGQSLVSGSGDGTARIWDILPRETHQKARREAEALRPEADRLVENLLRTKHNDAAAVVAAIREDRSLGERKTHAAFRAVLRRSAATARTPSETKPISNR